MSCVVPSTTDIQKEFKQELDKPLKKTTTRCSNLQMIRTVDRLAETKSVSQIFGHFEVVDFVVGSCSQRLKLPQDYPE